MKSTLKKILLTTLCLGGLVAVSGCNLTDLFNNKERTVNDTVDTITDSVTVSSDGYFRNERKYNANGNGQSYTLTFDKQGGLEIKDLSDESTKEYTYKVIDNLIEVKTKGENPVTDYIDYCENVLLITTHTRDEETNRSTITGGMTAILEGYVASEKGSTTIGFHVELVVKKGDVPAVLTGKKGSDGFAYAIKANGTWADKISSPTKYLAADQIAPNQFDTTEVGTKLVDVTINSKTYKAPFVVWGEAEAPAQSGENE